MSRGAIVVLLSLSVSACLPRERFNKNCQWTEDAAFQLDVRDARHRQHLVTDAQLAEELKVRYADFKHKEASGFEGHGGLLDGGKAGNECLARLDGVIAALHGVSREQIATARTSRDWRFDATTVLSFALAYAFAAIWSAGWMARRSSQNGPWFRTISAVLASVGASAVGVQLFTLWATTMEMIRIGNDHLGATRGLRLPWLQHYAELFVGGMIIFFAAALVRSRTVPDDETAVEPTLGIRAR